MIIINIKNPSIISKENLNNKDFNDIKELEKYCIEKDNISFKLELEYKLKNQKQSKAIYNVNEFMFFNDDLLIGYIGIGDFGGDSLEVTGMVHPDYRKMGIFTKLFSLVIDEWKKRKQKEMLLLCDRKSSSGIGFINNVCKEYDHSEYHMVLNKDIVPRLKIPSVSLRNAAIKDTATVAKMDSIFFNMEVKEENEFILENIENESTYIAKANNINIGKVRIEIIDGIGGIYGLGILPEYRGKGYGKELLLLSVNKLLDMGADEIVLQVEINNKNALSLYKSCGFKENYEMEYYKLSK